MAHQAGAPPIDAPVTNRSRLVTDQTRWHNSRVADRSLLAGLTRRGALRVPEITMYFWVIKALSTAMGEATSDYSVHAIDPVIAVILGFCGFVVALSLQFWVRRYIAWTYWLAVVAVGVFGTMAADVLHVALRRPVRGLERSLRDRSDGGVRRLAADRAYALVSHDRHAAPRSASTGPPWWRRSRWAPHLETSRRRRSVLATSGPGCCSPR